MTIFEFRKEYPMYDDIPTPELAKRLHATHFADIPAVKFMKEFMGKTAKDLNEKAAKMEEDSATVVEGMKNPLFRQSTEYRNALGNEIENAIPIAMMTNPMGIAKAVKDPDMIDELSRAGITYPDAQSAAIVRDKIGNPLMGASGLMQRRPDIAQESLNRAIANMKAAKEAGGEGIADIIRKVMERMRVQNIVLGGQ